MLIITKIHKNIACGLVNNCLTLYPNLYRLKVEGYYPEIPFRETGWSDSSEDRE